MQRQRMFLARMITPRHTHTQTHLYNVEKTADKGVAVQKKSYQ